MDEIQAEIYNNVTGEVHVQNGLKLLRSVDGFTKCGTDRVVVASANRRQTTCSESFQILSDTTEGY